MSRRTTPDQVRQRVCGDKVRHADIVAARRAARALNRDQGTDRYSHYPCPFCGAWHAGHLPSLESLQEIALVMRGLPLDPPQPHDPPTRERRRRRRKETRMDDRHVIDAMEKLVVTPTATGGLDVDASKLAAQHDPRHWWLHHLGGGVWEHAPSATEGPLPQMIRSIAMTYLVPAAGERS